LKLVTAFLPTAEVLCEVTLCRELRSWELLRSE